MTGGKIASNVYVKHQRLTRSNPSGGFSLVRGTRARQHDLDKTCPISTVS